MKSLKILIQTVLADAGLSCCTSTTKDLNTIFRRIEHEGLSFLTITLPTFCSDFERGLEKGSVDSSMFLSFSRGHGCLPRFLGGFTSQVFDTTSGTLLDDPSINAIFFIRQITLMFKKILLPCSKSRERSAYEKFIECELDVRAKELPHDCELLVRYRRVSQLLWASDCSVIDRLVSDGNLTPRHGPGATADKISGNRKFVFGRWTRRLEESFFPLTDYVIPSLNFLEDIERVNVDEPGSELPSRIISVPKTLKTPRIIAIEPAHIQYVQQSLLSILVPILEKSKVLKGALGFSDQLPNQEMARKGSIDGSYATIDLSEASDRVSLQLVKSMLHNHEPFLTALLACRSERADVPGFGVIPLAKFASMGSAVCFPVEAMVFLTIVLSGISRQLSVSLPTASILKQLDRVRIYGDDIIVPVEYVRSVLSELEAFGLRVNTGKTFWTGKFRESCGGDFYDGYRVNPVYLRRMLPTRLSDVSEMISCVSFRNQLYEAGLWKTAAYLDTLIGSLASFPTVSKTSPVLGRTSVLGYEAQRWDPTLHRFLVRGMTLKAKPRSSIIDGGPALLKFFLKTGVDPFFDKKHLERYGRPDYVDIKVRWAAPV